MLDQMVRTDEEDFNKLLAFALDKKPHTPLQLDKPKIYKICQAASEYITLHVDLVFEDFLTTYDEGNHQFAVFLAKETDVTDVYRFRLKPRPSAKGTTSKPFSQYIHLCRLYAIDPEKKLMQWVYYRPMKFTGNASDRALSMEMARQPSSWLEDVQSVKGKHAKWWSWSAKENVGCWEAAPKRKGDDRKDDSKCFPSCLFTEVTMKLNAIAISKWEAQEKAKAEKAKKAAAVAAQAKAAAATGRKRKHAISAHREGRAVSLCK